MNYQTINLQFQNSVCFLQFNRPEANNTINELLVEECLQALELCEDSVNVIVLEGLPEVFCFGADFQGMYEKMCSGESGLMNTDYLYDLWLKMTTGPYVTVSHVRGKVNAGGVGFVAASDIVLADQTAQFSLSELLFGVFPACVMPFLIRRVGFQKANYLTLTTKPITVEQAQAWGLVDEYDVHSETLIRKHLIRLSRLSKTSLLQYKHYISRLYDSVLKAKYTAVTANREIFSEPRVMQGIYRYVENGRFPWEV